MRVARTVAAVCVTTFRRLDKERVPEAAAGMAFYAIFSMFPLLLILVAVGSRFLDSPDAQTRLLGLALRFLPVSREFVKGNVLTVIGARGAVGGIGAVGLIWSATSAFSTLVRNLNRAWASARPRNLLGERLLALAMVGALVGSMIFYVLARALANLSGQWALVQSLTAKVSAFLPVGSRAVVVVVVLGTLTLLYRWLPRAVVLWREAAAGAIAASLFLWVATAGFTAFLGSGVVKYNVVYGSLGTLLALLSWVYIASVIVLTGAHLAAAVARHTRRADVEGDGAVECG